MNISKISIIGNNNFYALGIKVILQSLPATQNSEIAIYATGADYLKSEKDSDHVRITVLFLEVV